MPVIRAAHEGDLPAITRIYADAVAASLATWDEVAPDLERMTALYQVRTDAGYPYFVADAGGGNIAGYVCASAFHPQTGWRYTLEDSIYVAASAQRQGLGRRLLQALIDEAERRGFRQLVAGVSMPGGEASIAFHEALGFRRTGILAHTGWKAGQWLTALYLQRSLGEGADSPPE